MTDIAVLALQGAFMEHEEMLHRLDACCHEVRKYEDWLRRKDGLVIPGGESTTQVKLLRDLGLLQPIAEAIRGGLPVFGTCAGLILLAEQEGGEPRRGLATLAVDVKRNAYGRQLGSFNTVAAVNGVGADVPMVFVRAPYVGRVLSPEVEVLAEVEGHVVAVRQGVQLATAFHPELTADVRMHSLFLKMVAQRC